MDNIYSLLFLFCRIIQRTTETDYIAIVRDVNDWGCFSRLGKSGGRQTLTLNRGCAMYVGIPLHELMHAIGIREFLNSLMESTMKNILYNLYIHKSYCLRN